MLTSKPAGPVWKNRRKKALIRVENLEKNDGVTWADFSKFENSNPYIFLLYLRSPITPSLHSLEWTQLKQFLCKAQPIPQMAHPQPFWLLSNLASESSLSRPHWVNTPVRCAASQNPNVTKNMGLCIRKLRRFHQIVLHILYWLLFPSSFCRDHVSPMTQQ